MLTDIDWGRSAACRAVDPEALFVEGAAQKRATTICDGCPVRTECLAHALDHRIEHGIWGGATERERRALLRRRPLVTSWRRVLEAARAEAGSRAMDIPDASSLHQR
ncbi:WhiB family transcriptional regulator [Streptomyces sp. NPDC006678]|uniref:WhiB family transcriptional regulator n=1 Tax=unclassified Streptomyces TaxID=2593676 RepID=UPI0033BB09BE